VLAERVVVEATSSLEMADRRSKDFPTGMISFFLWSEALAVQGGLLAQAPEGLEEEPVAEPS
jgi:hypothetical protein